MLELAPILAQSGRADDGLAALERARAVFDRYGARPELARALLGKARLKLEGRW